MTPSDFILVLYGGFFLGSIYALMAIGLSLLWGSIKILNFAHGAVLTLGAYITWFFLSVLNNFLLAIILSLPIFFVLGVGIDKLIIHFLRSKPGLGVSSMLATLALAVVLENSILLFFGGRLKQLPATVGGSFELLALSIPYYEIVLAGVAIFFMIFTWAFLKNTRMGMAMRAVSQDTEGASLVGISIEQVYNLTFGLSTLLAGTAGVLIASIYFLTPSLGWDPFLKAFIIITFGGLGSTKGTVVASYVMGLIENFTMFVMGVFWAYPVLFLFMMVVIIVRPTGLFGLKEEVGK